MFLHVSICSSFPALNKSNASSILLLFVLSIYPSNHKLQTSLLISPESEGLGEDAKLSRSNSILFFSFDERESDVIESVKQIARPHIYVKFLAIDVLVQIKLLYRNSVIIFFSSQNLKTLSNVYI